MTPQPQSTRSPRRLILAALVGFAGLSAANAAEPAIDLAQPVAITCETSAVKLDANPFEATQGEVAIKLSLDDATVPKATGRWTVTSSPAAHAASFAAAAQACAPDCPMTRGEDGTLHLWSPKPMALTQLDDKTELILVTINPASLELKASAFRNKELSGLERGECKVAGAAAREAKSGEGERPAIAPAPVTSADPSTSDAPNTRAAPDEAAAETDAKSQDAAAAQPGSSVPATPRTSAPDASSHPDTGAPTLETDTKQ